MSNGNFTDLSILLQSGTSFDFQNSTYTYSAATDSALVDGVTFTGTIDIDGNNTGVIDGANAARGFDLSTNSALTLNKMTLQNGLAQYGSAVMNAGVLTLLGSTFTSNTATGSGGAIYSSNLFQSTNSVFSKNISNYGGAIFNQGVADFIGASFSGNTAIISASSGSTSSSGGYGGVMYNYYGTVTIEDSTVTDNTADYQGGFFYNYGYGTVASSDISKNASAYGGGAISNDGIIIVQKNTFSGNTATTLGGVINNSYMLIASSNTYTGNTSTFGGAVINFYESTNSYETYRKNTATTSGGALYNEKNAVIKNSLFEENKAVYGGAVMNNSTINISASTFTNNIVIQDGTAASQGGALVNYGHATVTTSCFQANTASGEKAEGGAVKNLYMLDLSANTFSGNRAVSGAAIFNSNTCTATGNLFTNNVTLDAATSGGNSGGAIYNEYVLTLTANTFSANTAASGSAIFNTGFATLDGNLIQNNTATYSSGALENYYAANLTANTISNNVALFGGAIMNSGYVYASSNTFANNTAFKSSTTGGSGGALYFGTASSGLFDNNIITGNTADVYGGGIYVQSGSLQFDNNTISANTSACGGAMFNAGTGTVKGNTFTANIATSGGAIYENGANTFTDNTFTDNMASFAGGAIYVEKILTLSGGTFSANIASGYTTTASTATLGGYGGAIANYGKANVSNVFFRGNTAVNGGAFFSGNTAQSTVSGNTFSANIATFGGAIMDFGNSEIFGNTFTTNEGVLSGGAIYAFTGESEVSDNKFIGNKAVSGAAVYVDNAADTKIYGNIFTSNVATSAGGGGIYTTGNAAIEENTFNMNGAIWGGAICNGGTAEVSSADNNFMANYAYYGGAVCNYEATGKVTLTSDKFYNNLALKSSTTGGLGGAVYNNGIMVIKNGTFSGNTSSYVEGATAASTEKSGGAIYNDESGVLTLESTSFLTSSDTVYNKGTLTIAGTVSFAGNFTSEKVIKTEKSGCFVIDLSSKTKGNDIAIISLFSNVADSDIKLAISFSGRREVGTYVLAEDVSATDLVGVEFSIVNADLQHTLGAVSYGTASEFGNDTYELTLNEGVLAVQVSTEEVLTDNDKKITVAKDENLSTAKNLSGILSVTVKKNGVFSGAGIETDSSKNASFTIEDEAGYISNDIISGGLTNFSISLKNNAAFVVYGKVDGFQKISTGKNALVNIKGEMSGDSLKNTSISFGATSTVTLESTVDMGLKKNSLSIGGNGTLTIAKKITGANTLTVSSGTQVTQTNNIKTQARTTMNVAGDLVGNGTYDNAISIGDYADLHIGGKIANDVLSTQVKVGANSTLTVDDAVQRIKSLNVSAGKEYKPISSGSKIQGITEVSMGDITGMEAANTISLGNFSTFSAKSIDLKDGKNAMSIGGRNSNVVIDGAVSNIYSLKMSNGGFYKNTLGVQELQIATLSINGKLAFSNYSDTLSVGKYAELDVSGNISAIGSGNIAMTIGTNGSVTAKKISGLSKLTLSDSATYTSGTSTIQGQTILTADAIESNDSNNTFSFGKYSYVNLAEKIITGEGNDTITLSSYAVVKTTCIEFGETGKNTVTVKQGAQLAVIEKMETETESQKNGDILNVNKLTVQSYSGQSYYALYASKISGSVNNDTFSFENNVYAQVDTIDFGSGNNKLKLGSSSGVQLTGALNFGNGAKNELSVGAQATFSCTTIAGANKITTSAGAAPTKKADAVYTKMTATAVSGTTGNDTYSFGNYTETNLGDIDFKTGNDTLKIGSNAFFDSGNISFGTSSTADKNAMSIGSLSDVHTGDVSGLNKLTLSAGKSGNAKKGELPAYTHVVLGAVTGTTNNDSFSIGNYADCVITGNIDLGEGEKDNITLGTGASLAIAGDSISNVSKIDLGKNGILGLNSTAFEKKDDLNIVGKGDLQVYDIGTQEQAKCFSGFGTEAVDNALDSASVLKNGSNGWLCATKDGKTYFEDAVDCFKLQDISASSLGKVTIKDNTGNAFSVYLYTKDSEGNWDDGQYVGSGSQIALSGVSGDVADYRVAVVLTETFALSTGGVTTYSITIA